MSEKEPNWEEKMEKIVQKVVRTELETQNKQRSPPSSEGKELPKEEHSHFSTSLTYLEDPENCPECKKGLEKFGKDYMKKVLTDRKDLPYECVECGTRVGEEEEECPTCGGKEAKQR